MFLFRERCRLALVVVCSILMSASGDAGDGAKGILQDIIPLKPQTNELVDVYHCEHTYAEVITNDAGQYVRCRLSAAVTPDDHEKVNHLVRTTVKDVTCEEMMNITATCGDLPVDQNVEPAPWFLIHIFTDVADMYNEIYPGTKWCGLGNKADKYVDLGSEGPEDVCCRNHDFCPVSVEIGQTLYGVNNPSRQTYSMCACDVRILRCLEKNGYRFLEKAFGKLVSQCLAVKVEGQETAFSTDANIHITPSTKLTVTPLCDYDPKLCDDLGLNHWLWAEQN